MNCMDKNCVYKGQKIILFYIRNSYILGPKLPKTPIFPAKIILYSSFILGKTWLTACNMWTFHISLWYSFRLIFIDCIDTKSELLQSDYFQGEFKVSSEINPAIIRFKQSQNDFDGWKDVVEKMFNVKLGVQGRGPNKSFLVYSPDFDAVLKFGDYLEQQFPADPRL